MATFKERILELGHPQRWPRPLAPWEIANRLKCSATYVHNVRSRARHPEQVAIQAEKRRQREGSISREEMARRRAQRLAERRQAAEARRQERARVAAACENKARALCEGGLSFTQAAAVLGKSRNAIAGLKWRAARRAEKLGHGVSA
jgi:hypothetical protein